jgi:hypothetical protein
MTDKTAEEAWYIGIDETDLNKILDKIDDSHGRNDALRDYIYALRDLAWANNLAAFTYCKVVDEEIDGASRAVHDAFDHLIRAQRTLSEELAPDIDAAFMRFKDFS